MAEYSACSSRTLEENRAIKPAVINTTLVEARSNWSFADNFPGTRAKIGSIHATKRKASW